MPDVYHLTHGKNLDSIIEKGAVLSKYRLVEEGIVHEDVAIADIQRRRRTLDVPIAPGGTLHEYVPFHFCPRSPMLYHVDRSGATEGGQQAMVHLVASTDSIEEASLRFVFTDGHAIMRVSSFHDDLGDIANLDWSIINDQHWVETEEDPDRQRRKQAEFLVFGHVPWRLIREVGVMNKRISRRAEEILDTYPRIHHPVVTVRPDWYYMGPGGR